MFRVLLFLILLGMGGPTFSQTLFKDEITQTISRSSNADIVSMARDQYSKNSNLGSYVRWGGTMLIGSALLYAALDWFYNQLQRQTGTPLDDWIIYSDTEAIAGYGDIRQTEQYYCPTTFCFSPEQMAYRCRITYRTRYYAFALLGNITGENIEFDIQSRCSSADIQGSVRQNFTQRISAHRPFDFAQPDRNFFISQAHMRQTYLSDLSWLREVAVRFRGQRPPLPDFLQANPSAASAMREQILGPYTNANPIGNPSSPYPGVRFTPTPNPNQWSDNPFTEPGLDTDGDGWPDSLEWKEANHRGIPWPDLINNPNAYPDPNGDPDRDGWTTREELDRGTDPYDASSKPQQPEQPTEPDPPTEPQPEEPQQPGVPSPVNPLPIQLPQVNEQQRPLPELEGWEQIAQSWKQNVQNKVIQRIQQLQTTLLDKFPFGIILIAQSSDVSTPSASCQFTFQIASVTGTLDICNNPIFSLMESFRPIWLGLLFLGFGYLLIRRALDIQR